MISHSYLIENIEKKPLERFQIPQLKVVLSHSKHFNINKFHGSDERANCIENK